jgi:hypothetical protein
MRVWYRYGSESGDDDCNDGGDDDCNDGGDDDDDE